MIVKATIDYLNEATAKKEKGYAIFSAEDFSKALERIKECFAEDYNLYSISIEMLLVDDKIIFDKKEDFDKAVNLIKSTDQN